MSSRFLGLGGGYLGEGGSGLYDGQDEGSGTKMVWSCAEEVRRRPSEEMREAGCRGVQRSRVSIILVSEQSDPIWLIPDLLLRNHKKTFPMLKPLLVTSNKRKQVIELVTEEKVQ
ncbi:hypothetical protein H5410_038041, partial [Solanum commersonii]